MSDWLLIIELKVILEEYQAGPGGYNFQLAT